jgi:hypothetical protein
MLVVTSASNWGCAGRSELHRNKHRMLNHRALTESATTFRARNEDFAGAADRILDERGW